VIQVIFHQNHDLWQSVQLSEAVAQLSGTSSQTQSETPPRMPITKVRSATKTTGLDVFVNSLTALHFAQYCYVVKMIPFQLTNLQSKQQCIFYSAGLYLPFYTVGTGAGELHLLLELKCTVTNEYLSLAYIAMSSLYAFHKYTAKNGSLMYVQGSSHS
jgi:hypothetical protein